MVRPASPDAALIGLRVLELTDQPAQYCGKLLADMGADVIKIEPPGGGAVRSVGPFVDDIPHPDRSLTFWHFNTSKRAVTLNLETEDGRALFRELAANADVIIESFKPGYMASLGLGYDELSKAHPKLIVCSITPFGQTGPWANYLSSDMIHLGLGGTMASTGYDTIPGAPPIAPTGGNAYNTASHIAASAIMVALLHAEATGEGQYIDQSIHAAGANSTELAFAFYEYKQQVPTRKVGRHAMPQDTPPWTYRAADGYVHLIGVRASAKLAEIIAWMSETGGQQELTAEMFTTPALVTKNAARFQEVLIAWVATRPSEELYRRGQALKVAWAKILSAEEMLEDEHLVDRRMFTEVEHPELGKTFTYVSGPFHFSLGDWEIRGRAPLVGEHNEEVFVGELGRDRRTLAALAESGVI